MLDPKLDVVFKMLMLRSERLLRSMLEAVLAEPVESFEVRDRSLPGDAPADKAIVVDLLVELADGRRVNVEMQVRATPELKPRIVFYAARNLTEQLSKGESYVQLRPSVVVVWLAEPLFGELDRFHAIFELYERHSQFRYGDELTLHLLQLSKLEGLPGSLASYEQQPALWTRS